MDTNGMETAWSRPTKYIVGVGIVILAIFILYLSRSILPLLVMAALIAVIARPGISWLTERARFPRGLAVAVMYLAIIIITPLLLLLLVPAIINAVEYLANLDYNSITQGFMEWLRSLLLSIRALALPGTLDAYVDQVVDEFLLQMQGSAAAAAPAVPSVGAVLSSLGAALTTTFSTAASVAGAVFTRLALIIFMLLASIYMSLSAHTYRVSFLNAVPAPYRPEISQLLARIGQMWASFFRGELILMLVIGSVTGVGLSILGIPGALSLGVIAGLLELIPSLGPIIATVPAVIVTLLQGSTYIPVSHFTMALIIVGFYILVQQLENNLIVPRVLGDAVELPPLVVIVGVLVGGTTAGILGTLLAAPVIATGREIFRYVYRKMLGEPPFRADEIGPNRSPSDWKPVQILQRWKQRLIKPRSPAVPAPEKEPEAEN